MGDKKLAEIIHVTGTQRSGHSFVGNVLTTNEGLAWWRQHDGEPWALKGSVAGTWQCVHPDLRFLKVPTQEFQEIFIDQFSTNDHPASQIEFVKQTIQGIRAIRVTEYQNPEWYERHVSGHVSSSAVTINVVRDPRNVLASAVGKGWDQEHCGELMAACEYQYVDEEIKACINVSYEQVVRHINDDSEEKRVGGIKLNDWALPAIKSMQSHQGNSSFSSAASNEEYFDRYKRPDIVANPIFQSLISKAEEIYNTHHVPFLERK